MFKISPPVRTQDEHGSGEYDAPRGSRTHNGIDLQCPVGSEVWSPVVGTITKIGYPYSNGIGGVTGLDPYRYVEVTDDDSNKHRLFYIEPMYWIKVDETVDPDCLIGKTQNLDLRYPGITPHVHYEIKDSTGDFINPMEFI